MNELQNLLQSALAGLVRSDSRIEAAAELAKSVGADQVLLLVEDLEVDALLPAPGLAKTLPGGPTWREFLKRCRKPGTVRGEVLASDRQGLAPVVACCGDGLALILVGGGLDEAALPPIASALPLLAAAVQAQHRCRIASAEVAACRDEMREAFALTRILDEARADLQRALCELDAQTASLQEARLNAESATRAKDQFLAMLGHELRNPLSPIVTALEILRRREQRSPEHEIIKRQLDHMVRLVDDLLDVSRIAQGKLSLVCHSVELGCVVGGAVETTRPLLDYKQQRLVFADMVPGMHVDGDAARLTQVFTNLLTNASKFSDPGSCIEIRTAMAGDWAQIEVRDQGIGIEPAMLQRVFDVFEQQGRSTEHARGGLGLGLAIVRNLVAMHGGRVRAQSAGSGLGSCFVVELPLTTHPAQKPPGLAEPALDAASTHRARVLLVDDNLDALRMLEFALSLEGHQVETAANGEDALQRARNFIADVAILDIGLPQMDGSALARELRLLPGWAGARLIALTGYGQKRDRDRAIASGFDEHVVKPVDLPRLRSMFEGLP